MSEKESSSMKPPSQCRGCGKNVAEGFTRCPFCKCWLVSALPDGESKQKKVSPSLKRPVEPSSSFVQNITNDPLWALLLLGLLVCVGLAALIDVLGPGLGVLAAYLAAWLICYPIVKHVAKRFGRMYSNTEAIVSSMFVSPAILIVVAIAAGAGLSYFEGHKATAAGFSSPHEMKNAEAMGFFDKAGYEQHLAEQAAERERVLREKMRAEQKAAETKRRAIEAKRQQRKLEKQREAQQCKADLKCWAEKNILKAAFACQEHIERQAKYDYEWVDGWGLKMTRYIRKNSTTITYMGDRIKLQNGFGAWARYIYMCDYQPDGDRVVSVLMKAGRLP